MRKYIEDINAILEPSEKRKFFILIGLNILLSIADILSLTFVFLVLNFYSGNKAGWISEWLSHLHLPQQSLWPGTFLIFIFLTKSTAGYFISKAQFRYISAITTRLTGKNLLLYLDGSFHGHVEVDSSVWVRRICFQPAEFAQYVLSGTQQVINESILIFITVIALAVYNFQLLLIVVLVLLPAVIILSYITKKKSKEIKGNIKLVNERSLQYLNEAISGYIESNIYNSNDFFNKRYTQSQSKVNRYVADMQVMQAMPNRFFEVFAILGLFILMAAISFNNIENHNTFLMLGAFVAASYKIIPGASRIISFITQVKTYLFTLTELSKSKYLNHHTDDKNTPSEIQTLELKNVSFAYGDTVVFNNLNFSLNKNSLTGLSGVSGKGKTTLIDLLLGFLTPNSGKVLVNGKEANSNQLKKTWPHFSYVKQTTFLVHDTILNNITLFKKNIDQNKIDHILEVTGLKEWVNQLPEGINMKISEGGKNISGGQRQRIAIARALYKDAPVIILDEPFNELDEVSEINLLRYLKKLSQNGKAILLVTHHLKSFEFCDHVIYLDGQK